MNQAEESELIAKALKGDGDAFSDLVKPYLGLFTAGIHRILQDPQDTQDALQEALLSLHTALQPVPGQEQVLHLGLQGLPERGPDAAPVTDPPPGGHPRGFHASLFSRGASHEQGGPP